MDTLKKNYPSLLFFLALIVVIQILGYFLTISSVNDWYRTLAKPSWNPPSWVFGPVWTILYLLIAISGWLIYIHPEKSNSRKTKALLFYSIQLLLNLLWSFFFFFLKNPFLAFLDIILLLVFIGFTIKSFLPISKIAATLLIPYFFWVCFASVLNFYIWKLNS